MGGRVRDTHEHDPAPGAGAQGLKGLRQGAPKRGKNTTLLASMTLGGAMGASMAVEGATDKEVFEGYVERFLAPTLEEGQIVVMDRLGAHRTQKVRELIEEQGAELWLLAGYSPDLLNPIEEAFSKIKGLLRRAGARTRESLVEAIGVALSAVTLEDAAE
ncbi:MAG: transposase [Actinomycetota bacterium]|nr:transposase [Actinomycetota bacterium]